MRRGRQREEEEELRHKQATCKRHISSNPIREDNLLSGEMVQRLYFVLILKADSAFVKTNISQCHKLAAMTWIQEPKSVNVQLLYELERQQQQARRNLVQK